MTKEALQYSMKGWNAYQKAYRDKHPEKKLQYRIQAAINLLSRNGYTVAKEGKVNE